MTKHLMKASWLLLLSAVIMVSGCAKSNPSATDTQQSTSPSPSQSLAPSTSSAPSSNPTPQQSEINVYYGDLNEAKLAEKHISISYSNDSEKYLAALRALGSSSDTKLVPLCKDFNFKSAEFKDGDLTLDISIPEQGRLGSQGEELLLQALQQTLFQFPEVQSIDILLDGNEVESLMGHMDLPHPIKRN